MRIGKIEQAIIDALHEDGPQPVRDIAWCYHNRAAIEAETVEYTSNDPPRPEYEPLPRAVYESFRRAAHRLEEKGLAVAYHAHIPIPGADEYRLCCRLPEQDHDKNEVRRITRKQARKTIIAILEEADGKLHRTALKRKVAQALFGRRYVSACTRTVRRAIQDLIDEETLAAEYDDPPAYRGLYGRKYLRLNVALPETVPATQHKDS